MRSGFKFQTRIETLSTLPWESIFHSQHLYSHSQEPPSHSHSHSHEMFINRSHSHGIPMGIMGMDRMIDEHFMGMEIDSHDKVDNVSILVWNLKPVLLSCHFLIFRCVLFQLPFLCFHFFYCRYDIYSRLYRYSYSTKTSQTLINKFSPPTYDRASVESDMHLADQPNS